MLKLDLQSLGESWEGKALLIFNFQITYSWVCLLCIKILSKSLCVGVNPWECFAGVETWSQSWKHHVLLVLLSCPIFSPVCNILLFSWQWQFLRLACCFFPSPDGLDQSVYIAIIFLRSVSLGLTHSSVHQSQSTFSSGIATFHRKVRNNNFLTFPLKYGKLQKKTPGGLVGWAEQSTLVFQAWFFQHSLKFSYMPGRTRSGIKCIIFTLSQSLLCCCYECFLLVCLIPC